MKLFIRHLSADGPNSPRLTHRNNEPVRLLVPSLSRRLNDTAFLSFSSSNYLILVYCFQPFDTVVFLYDPDCWALLVLIRMNRPGLCVGSWFSISVTSRSGAQSPAN